MQNVSVFFRFGFLLRFLALALNLVSGFALGAETTVPAFYGQEVTGAGFGREFRLKDASGKWRTQEDYRGKLVLMFFGFTQCADVCPTELQRIARLMTALGKKAAHVQVLFVTLDPARDSATMIQSYVSAFNQRFIGLRADEAATAAVAKEFKVFFRKVPGSAPDRYSLDHSTYIYVLDAETRLRLRFTSDIEIDSMKADVLRLLAQVH